MTPDLTPKAVVLTAFGSPPPPVCALSGRALYVVEDETALNAGDIAVRDRLLQLGLQVTIESDGQLDSNDPVGKAVIVVSASVESGLVNTTFRGTAVPLVTWEHAIFDDLGMTPGASTDNGRDEGQLRVSVVGSAAPWSAGLSGAVQVLDDTGLVRWGRPFSSATVVARFDGDSARATYFAYETGAALANGRTAPARRVGTFFDELHTQAMTPAGWALFDTSIAWAVGAGTGRSVALLVTGDHDLETGDAAVKARLEGLGFAVHVVRNSWLPVVPLAGVRLIVVTESVDSATIGTRFRQVAIPVLNAEAQLFDELGMASTFGTESGQTRIAITDTASPLTGGLTGQPTVNNTTTEIVWATPGSAARIAATVVGKPARAALFSYETGAAMPGLAAPARRVGFFMFQGQTLTSQGWASFDASVNWAVANTPAGVPGLCPVAPTCVPRGTSDTTCDGVDDDCDGVVDDNYAPTATSCGVGACARTGQNVCQAGRVVNTCAAGTPAANDAMCDGVDNDCSGATDEDYVPTATSCGVGACARTGQNVCSAGHVVNTCAAGTPAPSDASCDGVDNDCSGTADEDYVVTPTACGVGACADTGSLICQGGVVSNTCSPGMPAPNDSACDGVDNDCSGAIDEDYVATATSCGVGTCARTGQNVCSAGHVVDTCAPGTPAPSDASCDGLDNDCSGQIDEDYVDIPTTCGVGACGDTGALVCQSGAVVNTCAPGTPAGSDPTCDQIDDDCDGTIDDDFEERFTTCGVGACTATGRVTCVAGDEVDDCQPNPPAASDSACDGVDNDCNGATDEDYVPTATTCGVGACGATGTLVCEDGGTHDTCVPGVPGTSDASCDGIDNDCSGQIDEDYVAPATSCGVGTCAAIGVLACENGGTRDTCAPGVPGTDDASCDGLDNDCSGQVDEDYVATPSACGVGACAAIGEIRCQGGDLYDSCEPSTPADDDTLCNGVDDDCDAEIDEDYVPTATSCGVGTCGDTGELACVDGALVDTCSAAPPGPNDALCNGADDDCSGQVDEDFVEIPTTCGVGACVAAGALTCQGGAVVDTCIPLPAPDVQDTVCDNIDVECDGRVDDDFEERVTTCGVGACTATGRLTCVAGSEVDDCQPNPPAAFDAGCDGIDNDCDGEVDEDYVPTATTCGVGACSATGQLACVDGALVDSCTAGTPAPSDASCDGIDNDCSGQIDEDYIAPTTTCGVGACGATGSLVCENGVTRDTCSAGTPAANDAACDGIDNDCSGQIDEDYIDIPTTCGVGACGDSGALVCQNGQVVDTCVPGTPAPSDASCDGIDNDCSGAIDEDYIAPTTTCGVGACGATGNLVCENGVTRDTCSAGTPAANDAACDGIDNDCSGQIDEDYIDIPTTCGVGACGDSGALVCQNGQVVDTCAPGMPAPSDASCDGIDNDCSGAIDEDYVPTATTCGVGACGAVGQLACVSGTIVDTCTAGPPRAGLDFTCDNIDDDCDGSVDDDFQPVATTCGVGACAGTGQLTCSAGVVSNSCVVGTPALSDASCDGIDNDCSGQTDEDYIPPATTCGVGACSATGVLACVGGQTRDTCAPGVPGTSDASCDGVDNDCSGQIDEDYVDIPTTCGVGTCGDSGALVCQNGSVVNTCVPGTPGASDASCDGLDNDCSGQTDEDYVPPPTTCGVGTCAGTGVLACENGGTRDTCAPGTPALDDASCDGLDNDCSGTADEDYVPPTTTCGVGACGATGSLVCENGGTRDTCAPGTPAANDATCDLVDDDCDGTADDDFEELFTTCGVGACTATGRLTCVNGSASDDCAPNPPAPNDASCDGIDNDCNGATDEDYVPTATSCGVGTCGAAGTLVCEDGATRDTCVPGTPGASDASCDGLDNDCSGQTDEDYVPPPTTCGVGTCAATGVLACENGGTRDTCAPGTPALDDASCDGLDNDCSGQTDEDYVPPTTTCGVGACGATGSLVCENGGTRDTCAPGTPAPNDATCDLVDDDCDGTADDDFEELFTTCGVGACTATGRLTCVNGSASDDCAPNPPAPNDASCDGIDNDCNGATDEDYVPTATSCGVGTCGAAGTLVCEDGATRDTCVPGTPGASDASCDGLDNDCSGQTDEDYVPPTTTCGVGTCAATGVLACENGGTRDTCAPGTPALDDASCDGLDNDCSGQTDEDYVPPTTTCGVGACGATGSLVCENGGTRDTCAPGTPAANDATCDLVDDDCDGTADDDFEELFTTCGVGACTATGRLTCVNGSASDDCAPNPPAASDASCDGIDNDCNGATDEDYLPTVTTCGVGACAASGMLACIDGAESDSCTPGTPAGTDACDGVDNDCSGTTDEDHVPVVTTCGVGACTRTGVLACTNGAPGDTCLPGEPLATTDTTCDGIDDDCDGLVDDDFAGVSTACGVGACAASGALICQAGAVVDTCAPGPAAPDDRLCDGIDADCSGQVDEDYLPETITCGVGACSAIGITACTNGTVTGTCTPGTPAPRESCDTIDNDCDGQTDEPDGTLRWSQVTLAGPPPRWGAAMARDEARDQLVLFGGSRSGVGSVAETWVWDGTGWELVTRDGPPERIDHAMAYDADRGRIVLFGGLVDSLPAGDTWEWDGASWQLVATTGPSPRYATAMAYDAARGVTVLFGGLGAGGRLGDTWEWDGASWQQRASTGPSPRKGHTLELDPIRGAVVLFGGFDGLVQADRWEWTGAAWIFVGTGGPAGREEHTMVFDEQRAALVMFGGIAVFSQRLDDVWRLAGTTWQRITAVGPSRRFLHVMGYDAVNQSSLVYGGVTSTGATSGETWLLGEECF